MITRLMRFFWWIGHSGTSAVMAAQFGLAMMPLWSRMRRALISGDRKSTRLNSSHGYISYAVFRLQKKKPGYHAHRVVSRHHHFDLIRAHAHVEPRYQLRSLPAPLIPDPLSCSDMIASDHDLHEPQ